MELGVLIRDEGLATQAARHFDRLIGEGLLARVKTLNMRLGGLCGTQVHCRRRGKQGGTN
jgi:hypothetical protein